MPEVIYLCQESRALTTDDCPSLLVRLVQSKPPLRTTHHKSRATAAVRATLTTYETKEREAHVPEEHNQEQEQEPEQPQECGFKSKEELYLWIVQQIRGIYQHFCVWIIP